ncbi:MAG: hypothetical protein ACKVXR_09340 [Planctomycetota bacterium]
MTSTNNIHRDRASRPTLLVIAALCALGSIPVRAGDVMPGSDLLFTPAPGPAPYTAMVVVPPMPAGAFGAGSDPFPGVPPPGLPLMGLPLDGTPPLDPVMGHGIPGQSDTIVNRLTVAPFPVCPGVQTIPIELVALNLVSVQPITVTFGGGASSAQWEVRVCRSLTGPQQQGQMTITHDSLDGGTFTSFLPVRGRLMFAKCNPNSGPGLASPPDLDPHIVTLMTPVPAPWVHQAPPTSGVMSSPGGVVDHDCLPTTVPTPYPPTSNFVPAFASVGGNCTAPGVAQHKELTREEEMLARHGILPPNRAPGTQSGFGDGSMGNCPCLNNSTVPGRGCQHSDSAGAFGGAGGLLFATGKASVAVDAGGGPESLTLRAIEMRRPPTVCVFWQGTVALAVPVIAGDGLRFIGGALRRIGIKPGCNGKASYGAGLLDVPVSVSGLIPAAGGTRHYQVAFRDGAPAFCLPAETVNWTNMVSIPWNP